MISLIKDCICKQCNIIFKGGPRAYYCPSCREDRKKETNRSHRENKKAGNSRTLGATDICQQCGGQYMITAGLQRFCPDCKKSHNLEHDRVTGLAYYHTNKNDINPERNKKRRIGVSKCEWCGATFVCTNSAITCSPECKRALINHKWNIRRNKKG